MKPSVYLETTIISNLTADPSRDIVIAGHQQVTHDWWNTRRQKFDLLVSQLVVSEIRSGDPVMAAKRLDLIKGLKALSLTETALDVAQALVSQGPLPKKAAEDALHIALASVYGMDYLLSWNCKHISNLFIQKDLAKILARFGFRLPTIGSPEALMGE
jgi:hypothetical protein